MEYLLSHDLIQARSISTTDPLWIPMLPSTLGANQINDPFESFPRMLLYCAPLPLWRIQGIFQPVWKHVVPVRRRVMSHGTRMLALPREKLPQRTVDIFCSKCKQKLYKYRKGGKGALVKCWIERIAHDYTNQPCVCPNCQSVFGKEAMVRGRPAHKIIRDRVFTR